MVDLAAAQNASLLQESNQEFCLPDPQLSEISVTEDRSITEHITCPAAPTLPHFEVFTNLSIPEPNVPNKDTVLSTEKDENKHPVTKVTAAVSAKPGSDWNKTMLKTSDTSDLTKESLDENKGFTTIETDKRDQVNLPVRKKDSNSQASDREAEEVADGDQNKPGDISTDLRTQPPDFTTSSIVLASQDTKSQEEMTLVIYIVSHLLVHLNCSLVLISHVNRHEHIYLSTIYSV